MCYLKTLMCVNHGQEIKCCIARKILNVLVHLIDYLFFLINSGGKVC